MSINWEIAGIYSICNMQILFGGKGVHIKRTSYSCLFIWLLISLDVLICIV